MRQSVVFAGIQFVGDDRGDGDVSVRINTFRKILLSGHVEVRLNYHNDEQGKVGDQDRKPTVQEVIDAIAMDKPNVLYYHPSSHTIRCSPHRNLSYTIHQKYEKTSKDLTFGGFFHQVLRDLCLNHHWDDPYAMIEPMTTQSIAILDTIHYAFEQKETVGNAAIAVNMLNPQTVSS